MVDITDSYRSGKQEIKLSLKPEARYYGLTLQDLGSQVRSAFYGYEAQRIQRGRDDVRVMVRYPSDDTTAIGAIENMFIRAANGAEIPFSSVARVDIQPGFTSISRVNGQRVVNVRAEVMRDKVTPEQVLAVITNERLPQLLETHPGVSFSLA